MGRVMLVTKADEKQLLKNGALPDAEKRDLKPVIKVFNPYGAATWLISEIDPEDPDRMFGLCDLGQGYPELGYVSRSELESVQPIRGLYLERDRWFSPDKTLAQYTKEAQATGRLRA